MAGHFTLSNVEELARRKRAQRTALSGFDGANRRTKSKGYSEFQVIDVNQQNFLI